MIEKFLIPPLMFWILLKRMIKGEDWYQKYKETIKLKKLELSHWQGEIIRIQSNYDNGWRPSNPKQFKAILEKIKEHL